MKVRNARRPQVVGSTQSSLLDRLPKQLESREMVSVKTKRLRRFDIDGKVVNKEALTRLRGVRGGGEPIDFGLRFFAPTFKGQNRLRREAIELIKTIEVIPVACVRV